MTEQLRGCTNEAHNHTKIEAVQRANHVLEEHINNKSDFSDDEALHLGYEYVQRWFELIFFLRDNSYESRYSRGETGPEPIMENLAKYLESALFLTQEGDYAQLKKVLLEQGNHLIKGFSRSLYDRDSQRQVHVGRNLIKIAETMQLNGDPIYPLTPAWMDSRFNGDLE